MTTITAPNRLQRRSREALSTLGLQFLLGMGANLIGTPSENTGAGRVAAGVVLGLHVLIGVGLIVVAIRLLAVARADGVGRTEALWGLVLVVVTFLIGLATTLTGSEWLSFLMAVGFTASAALYVRTLLLGSARG
ncbi:MAG TPA: hypothetical protein VIG76_05865 [Amnibacterium sp.]|jgi:hypothetical protein|uniref:hypothetical protein n=1 Tax=Amnibacterium sp. TaxID=1872496 RepID=UPI002F941082